MFFDMRTTVTTSRARLTGGLLALLVVTGCDGGSSASEPNAPRVSAQPPQSPAQATGTTSASPSPAPSSGPGAPTGSPSSVTNPVFPLTPGIQSVRQGFVNKGRRRLQHRRVYTITDVRKVVDGVNAVIALDQDFDGGELAEQSLEILALDTAGSVLYLGSYTESYEGGQFVNFTDAWLSGVKGGRAGILVPGKPEKGVVFTQAEVPGEGSADGEVVSVGGRTCVPFRCYSDVVVIEEGGSEWKYYAPGVGGILTKPLSGDPQETEELINVTSLSASGLDEISAEVLKLDQHARRISTDVYGTSSPAERSG